MSELFDEVTRVVAAPISRREALKMIAGTVGAVILSRFFGAPRRAMAIVCWDPYYPHVCGDICCKFDWFCASPTLLNGAGTHGQCCWEGSHLCSGQGYGWCCESNQNCSTELWKCACMTGTESCGNACCNTAAGEFCCDPDRSRCCAAGVECCFDENYAGVCCSEGTKCVPISATGYPAGNVCCPVAQACLSQCCPEGEKCFMDLACCPDERINPDRDGCCPAGFRYFAPTDSCCPDGRFCGAVCCPAGQVCQDGTCRQCPDGKELCFDVCCAASTCCFGKCCGDGQTCTGECTTLETITKTIDPDIGGDLNSSDGGVSIRFSGIGSEETVRYTSQAQPGHGLPEHAQLLRSFTLITPAGSRSQQVASVSYTMHVRFTEATLAAMGIESEYQLKLLWWKATNSAWSSVSFEMDRPAGEITLSQTKLGEFALVAVEKIQDENRTVYLPLVTK